MADLLSGAVNFILVMILVVFGYVFWKWLRSRNWNGAPPKPRQEELPRLDDGLPRLDDMPSLPPQVPIAAQQETASESNLYKFDDETLRQASQMLDSGADIDFVCGTINPEYAVLDAGEQRIFRMMLKTTLRSSSYSNR